MVKDAEAHAEEDKKRREEAEARNTAEQLVYSTEKFLADNARQAPGRRPRRRSTTALADLKDGPQGRAPSATAEDIKAKIDEARPRSPRSWARRCTPQPPAEHGGCRRRRAPQARRRGADRRRRRDDDVVDAEVVDDDEAEDKK